MGETLAVDLGHTIVDIPARSARWMDQPLALGRHLGLGTGSLSTLGWRHDLTVIEVWNDRAHLGHA